MLIRTCRLGRLLLCVGASIGLLASCATERLGREPPPGVNLSGEWNFNPNLSDDPDRLQDADKPSKLSPGSHHGHGGGRGSPGGIPGPGGGLPEPGEPDTGADEGPGPTAGAPGGNGFVPVNFTGAPGDYTFQRVALAAPQAPAGEGADTPAPPPPAPSHSKRDASLSRQLQPPLHISIDQQRQTVRITSEMPDGSRITDELNPGTAGPIPYGADNSADRSVGWRGPALVIDTKPHKGREREDYFALDDTGQLILTTRIGKVEVRRVYDRARSVASTRGA